MANEAEVYGQPEEAPGSRLLRHGIHWQSAYEGDASAEEWLCEPILARGRGHALYAPAKAGKSLFALSIAAAVATGSPFLHMPAGEPLRVLYVDYEMLQADVIARLQDMGYYRWEDLQHFKYVLWPDIDPLDSYEGGKELAAAAQAWAAHLVVIDTTGRSIRGSENDADTFLGFYRNTGMLLKGLGVTWLRLDHAGKDYGKGQRGSSAKNDDVDVVWSLVRRDSDNGTVPYQLEATHRRLSWVPPRIGLSMHTDDESGLLTWTTEAKTSGYPAGTAKILDALRAAGVTGYISQRAARDLLAGTLGLKQSVLVAALKLWNQEAETAELLGDTSDTPDT